jgi:hypothetical protein
MAQIEVSNDEVLAKLGDQLSSAVINNTKLQVALDHALSRIDALEATNDELRGALSSEAEKE